MRMKSGLQASLLALLFIPLAACQGETYYEKVVVFDETSTLDEKVFMAAHVVPTPEQMAWQELEMTAFIHFGINTFVGREWGDGTEPPEKFNPSALDAHQWVKALKDGGMKMVILTAKHHDGFCLWPTETTEHSVKTSPWRDGKGDLVREVKEACDAHGVKFGVYLSPWDRNATTYGDSPRYNAFFRQQLTELLSWYGRVDEVWFDGACGEGPNGKRQEYDWASYYAVIDSLQPQAVVAIQGEDVRWVGTESGYGRPTEWSVTALAPGGRTKMEAINERLGINAMSEDLGSRELIEKADRLFWYPAEVDVSIRPGWFYHQAEDERVKSLTHLVDIYFNSVGMNAVLLLNVPPDQRGLIHETDVARLREFGEWVKVAFSVNLLEVGKPGNRKGRALIDNNGETYWTVKAFPGILEFNLQEEQKFDVIELKEYIAKGQRVESFHMEAFLKGQWTEIASGTTIGHKRLLKISPVTTDRVRLVIAGARHDAHISGFGLYLAPEILSDPVITRDKEGLVNIQSETDFPVITYTIDGSEPDSTADRYTGPFQFPGPGIVKARAFIHDFEVSGGVIAETFDISPSKWTLVEASEGHAAFPAAYAIDGDKTTMWHTHWEGEVKAHPHSITVDMGEEIIIKGFTYAPRTDGNFSGTVLRYSFSISVDGVNWQKVIDGGVFDNMVNNPSTQRVVFEKAHPAKYFRFVSHQGIYGEPWVSVGEVGVITGY